MKQRFVQRFVAVLGADVIQFTSMIVVTPVLVRLLTTTEYGTYVFLLAVFEIGHVVANAGLTDNVKKHLGERREIPAWQDQVFGYLSRVAVVPVMTVCITLLALAITGVSERIFGGSLTPFLPLLIPLLFVHQYFFLLTNALMALNLERYSETLRSSRAVVFALGAVTLAWFGYGIRGVLVGHIVASLLGGIAAIGLLTTQLDVRSIFRRTHDAFPRRELLNFNAFSSLYAIFYRSFYYADVVLVQAFLGGEQTAYYGAALMLSELLWFVPTALRRLLLHSVSDLWRRDQTDVISDLVARLMRYVLALSTILAIGLGVLANEAIELYYGADFMPAVPLLVILLPGTVLFALVQPLLTILQAKGQQGQIRLIVLTTGLVSGGNLLLNLALIPRYGAVGAAVATTVGYAAMIPVSVWVAGKANLAPFSDVRPVAIVFSTTLTLGVLVIADRALASTLVSLVVLPLLGLAVYTVTTLYFGLFDDEEVRYVIDALPNTIGRALHRVASIF